MTFIVEKVEIGTGLDTLAVQAIVGRLGPGSTFDERTDLKAPPVTR